MSSFGWSAGDIVCAIKLLVDVGKALKESGGAAANYQETTRYLAGLATTLEELGTYYKDHASQARIEALQNEISAVTKAVQTFKDKIDRKFDHELGGHGGRGWRRRIFSCPRKLQYAFFVAEEATSLQDKIATPLRSIQINLGIETRSAVSDLQSEVSKMASLLATKADEQSRMKDRELLQKVGEWLSPVSSTESDFEAFKRGLRPGTCEWIFNDQKFSRWMDFNTDSSGPPLFWVSGIPGAGKSYLATRIIKELRELCPVAYFYCDAKDEQKRSVLNILCTWAWQLLQCIPNCLAQIDEISTGAKSTIANMLKALELLAMNETGCRFVLDGLDECDPVARRELFEILPDILSHSRVLIVSRDERDINSGISKSGKSKGYASFRISEEDNGNDITAYIQAEVDDMELDDKALEEKIRGSLQRGARGMFLWARLMIEDLSVPGRSVKEYEAALEDLPQGLDELYGRVLDRLCSDLKRRDRSLQIFQWLACACRPLTIGELNEALAIGLDDEHFQPKRKIPKFAATLRQCCGPLVNFDASDETIPVTLIHASVKEFLLSAPGGNPTYSLFIESTIAHAYIARACLTYLGFNEIELVNVNGDRKGSLQKLDAHIGAWYLLNYASLHWYVHLKGCLTSQEAIQSFKRFYSSEESTVKWLQLVSRLIWSVHSDELIVLLNTFQEVELLENDPGYLKWLQHLNGPDFTRWQRFMNSQGSTCLPVLHICAFFDFATFTQKLIRERDFVVDLCDHRGRTALHQAGRGDTFEVSDILIAAGASVDAKDVKGWTPRMYEDERIDLAFPPRLVYPEHFRSIDEAREFRAVDLHTNM